MIRAFLRSHWTIVSGLLLVGVGFATLLIVAADKLYVKLLIGVPIEVGFAFIIAWVVGLTVEREARRELSDHALAHSHTISENVFKYLYSVKLPRDVFNVVADYVFKEPVIKTRQLLEFELYPPADGSDWIKMRCSFDYTLKNISEQDIDHPIKFHTSKVSGLNEPKDSSVGLASLIIGDRVIDKERFEEIDKAAPDDVGQQKYQEIERIPKNSELRVQITFYQHKRVNDNDLFQTNCVCEKTDIRVRFDPDVFNLFLEPVHPSNKFDSFIEPNHGADNCIRAQINRPLLPKNGVFMWWNRKEVAGVTEA